jgi:hypothetical protein
MGVCACALAGGSVSRWRGQSRFWVLGQESALAPAEQYLAYTHVLLLDRALAAVVRVRHPDGPADDAAALEHAKAALVAHAHERVRAHVRVAHGALAVAALAESADGCWFFVW